jgi:hypothetical protein
MPSVEITDNFSNYFSSNFNLNKYSIFSDIIFYGIIIYTYYIGMDFHYILKYIGIIFILRYTLGYLTNIKKDGKTIYQINSNLAIYSILVLLLMKKYESNTYLEYTSIILYTLFLSAIGNGYTVDNIFTLMLVYIASKATF